MIDPNNMGVALSNAMVGMMPNLLKWVGIIVISLFILLALWLIYYFFSHRHVITKIILGQIVTQGVKAYYVRSVKRIRARMIKSKGIEKIQIMFSKINLDPSFHTVYPGNNMFLYQLGNELFLPLRLNVSENPGASFEAIPYSIRRWQNLEIQEAFRDYSEHSMMEKYGGYIAMIIVVIFCCALVGFTFWIIFRMGGANLDKAVQSVNTLADALKSGVVDQFSPK